MRALEFITGHVIYNPAYIYKFQLKTTNDPSHDFVTDLVFTISIQNRYFYGWVHNCTFWNEKNPWFLDKIWKFLL